MSSQVELERLRWACRRGMLEIDLFLMPFVESHYEKLSKEEQGCFEHLLEQDDPALFRWLMGHEQCSDPMLAAMIKTIQDAKKDSSSA